MHTLSYSLHLEALASSYTRNSYTHSNKSINHRQSSSNALLHFYHQHVHQPIGFQEQHVVRPNQTGASWWLVGAWSVDAKCKVSFEWPAYTRTHRHTCKSELWNRSLSHRIDRSEARANRASASCICFDDGGR